TSTSCCRRRFPLCLLTCRNEIRSLAATAGYKATVQETRESFKKPFQCARGTTLILHTHQTPARTTPQMAVRTPVFESHGHTEHETRIAQRRVPVPGRCRPRRKCRRVPRALAPGCRPLFRASHRTSPWPPVCGDPQPRCEGW